MGTFTFTYPLKLSKDDNGTLLVQAPDFPELITDGDNREDALKRAQDAMRAVLSGYMERGQDIPEPSDLGLSNARLTLPTLLAGKVAIYRAMRARKVSQRQLAKRLGIDEGQVRRLLDPLNQSRFDGIDDALIALGCQPELVVRPIGEAPAMVSIEASAEQVLLDETANDLERVLSKLGRSGGSRLSQAGDVIPPLPQGVKAERVAIYTTGPAVKFGPRMPLRSGQFVTQSDAQGQRHERISAKLSGKGRTTSARKKR